MRKGSCPSTLSSWHWCLSSHAFWHPSFYFITRKCIKLIVVLTGIYTTNNSFGPAVFLFQLASHCGAAWGKHGKQKLQRAPPGSFLQAQGHRADSVRSALPGDCLEIQQIVPEHGDRSCAVWFKLVVSVLPCWEPGFEPMPTCSLSFPTWQACWLAPGCLNNQVILV